MEQSPELVQGPVPKWQPSPENQATIDRLLASEDDLERAYGEAYSAGCFVKEFAGADETKSIAAVGEFDKAAILEFRLGIELNTNDLSMGECISLGAYPGTGANRAESVRDGLRQLLESKEKTNDPEALDLFGSFNESGYKIEAYMPINSKQELQWTVKIYNENDEEPFRIVTIPMVYEPIYGVDVSDKATLEAGVDELLQELTASA